MIIDRIVNLKHRFSEDQDLRELLKNSGIAFFLKVAGTIVGYSFTVIVTRHYGAEAWGIFSICLMFLQISGMFGRLGTDIALLRFISEFMVSENKYLIPQVFRKILLLTLSVSSALSFILFLFAKYIAVEVFHDFTLIVPLKLVSAFVIPFVVLWITREAIRGLKKITIYMLLQQLGVFGLASLILVFSLMFLKTNHPYLIPILSYGISVVVFTTFLALFLWRKYLKTFSLYVKPALNQISYKYILSVSLPLLFSSVLAFIMGWTDTFMIGIFKTTRDVGIYNVVLKLSTVISIVLFSINSIAAPKFAEFWGRKDLKGLARVARQSARLIFWTSLPILVVFVFFSKQILLIFGKDFIVASSALVILSLGQFVNAIVGSVGYILMMTGKERTMQNIIFGGAFINVVLNACLIPHYGINGAAIASAISLAFINIVPLFLVKKYYGFYTINII
ncbi:flippase [Desulfurobacterium sp.]